MSRGGRGSGVLTLILGILIGGALGGVGVCFAIGSGIIDTADARFQQLFGSHQDIDTTSTSSVNLTWPAGDLRGAIPEPEIDAALSEVSTSQGAVSVVYANVPVSDVVAYVDVLKDKGYVFAQSETKLKDGYSYAARNDEDVMKGATVVVSRELDGRFCIVYSDPPNRL